MRHNGLQANKGIKTLEQQVRDLQQHVQSLEAQHRTLSVQHHILDCFCQVLHLLRTGNVHVGWVECKGTWMPDELLLLRDLGVQFDDSSLQLLDQLDAQLTAQQASTAQEGQQQQSQEQLAGEDLTSVSSSRDSSSLFFAAGLAAGVAAASTAAGAQEREDPASSSTAAALPAAGQLPVTQPSLYMAVPGDFLGRMKYSLSQPPAEGAAEWTVQHFVDYYTALVKELGLLLVLVEQQSCDRSLPCDGSTLHPLQALQQLALQHAHVINTILLLHKDDLLNKIRVVNLSTLELDDEQAWQRMCWLAKALDLSEEQQRTIVAGAELFIRLLDHVRAERQALTAQQGQQVHMRLATGRAVDLQSQEDSATRLHLLIKKENFLLTCAGMFVADVLTTVQLARAAVLAWPYAPQIGMLGPVLILQHGQRPESLLPSEDAPEATRVTLHAV